MKSLKKLALATAIASAPFAANALEALDDEFLGDVTGQEGITIDREYMNTIEEFQYVDADGDGSGVAGKVAVKDIKIGNWAAANLGTVNATSTFVLGQVLETGQTIDATANGVLIGAADIGVAAVADTNAHAAFQASAAAVALGTTSSGNDITFGGVTKTFTAFADGKDISIGGIEFGNAAGSMNSIGEARLLNVSNYATAGRILTLVSKYGVGTGAQKVGLFANNANTFIERETLVSSKASGTGVVIEAEGGMSAQAAFYSDTDVGGGSVGVIGINQFRIVSTNARSADQDLATGTFIRGALTKTTIDVEGGKLVLDQKKQSSTVINSIFVAGAADLNTAVNTNGGAFSLGGIAILGNTWEGKTSIYAH